MAAMIDNITITRAIKPPRALQVANGQPFEWNGVIYSPHYSNGLIKRYDAQLRNLRLFLYSDRIYLCNSLHKYLHGTNHTDFTLSDFKASVEKINVDTGISWSKAEVKKIEYGCNIRSNTEKLYSTLQNFKGKDFQPMLVDGKQYGASVDFTTYRIKGYSKDFQLWKMERIRIAPTFRWEVTLKTVRDFQKFNASPLLLSTLIKPNTWKVLANDCLEKFKSTIRMQKLNLHLLSAHEKRIIAEMLVPEIREDLKRHNKETYKRDRRIYRRIMADKTICEPDNTIEEMRRKFEHLISVKSSAKEIAVFGL